MRTHPVNTAPGLHSHGTAAPPQAQPPSVTRSEGLSVWSSQTQPDPAQFEQPTVMATTADR